MGRLGKYGTMNYIEELNPGDIFEYNNQLYLLTIDFKKNESKLSVSLLDGSPKWVDPSLIVNKTSLYKLDNSNNILPIREEKNKYDITKN